MELLHILLLGVIQGITEFLPISSSGHLILARHLFSIPQESQAAFIYDVLIQLGTWVAVLVYYRDDIRAIATDMWAGLRGRPGPQARLGWLIALATLPAVLIGWPLKDWMAGELSGLFFTGVFLLVNAGLLALAEWVGRRSRSLAEANWQDSLWIGLGQALALLPAVSRSAGTMAGGMLRNFNRRDAARFAFLMSVPVMPAAAVAGFWDLGHLPDAGSLGLPLLGGFLVSAVVGYFSIRWLISYLSRNSFFPFAIYCSIVGLITLFFS